MIRIQEEDFSVEDEIKRVKSASLRIGGIVTFLGTVRDFSRGKDVEKLVFEHYPGMAEQKLTELRERALKDFDIIEVSIVHRTGEIKAGENIVLMVVGAEHRADAFTACQWLIDELKKMVPIWKKEFTAEGEVWVEDHP
jgi:molybdopterin synthase catalytic subunit